MRGNSNITMISVTCTLSTRGLRKNRVETYDDLFCVVRHFYPIIWQCKQFSVKVNFHYNHKFSVTRSASQGKGGDFLQGLEAV